MQDSEQTVHKNRFGEHFMQAVVCSHPRSSRSVALCVKRDCCIRTSRQPLTIGGMSRDFLDILPRLKIAKAKAKVSTLRAPADTKLTEAFDHHRQWTMIC